MRFKVGAVVICKRLKSHWGYKPGVIYQVYECDFDLGMHFIRCGENMCWIDVDDCELVNNLTDLEKIIYNISE